MKMYTRDVVIDREEATLLIQALKLLELADGETEMTRLLVQRFRRVRSLISGRDEPDNEETQAAIFSAGVTA